MLLQSAQINIQVPVINIWSSSSVPKPVHEWRFVLLWNFPHILEIKRAHVQSIPEVAVDKGVSRTGTAGLAGGEDASAGSSGVGVMKESWLVNQLFIFIYFLASSFAYRLPSDTDTLKIKPKMKVFKI